VHEVEVKVLELQVRQAAAGRRLDVLRRVVRVPKLARHPELGPCDEAERDGFIDALAHLHLVAVCARACQGWAHLQSRASTSPAQRLQAGEVSF